MALLVIKVSRFKFYDLLLCRLKDLHHSCTKEMDSYAGCMYYNTDEFELCRKEQKVFEKACPL